MTVTPVTTLAVRAGKYVNYTVSAFGERHDIAPLVYHPGVMYSFDRAARKNAPGFAACLYQTFGNLRYLDVGAGTGRFVEALRRLGADADACEYSRWGRLFARTRGLAIHPFDLTRDNPGPDSAQYGLAFCLEVAEHLPPDLGDRLVAYLAGCEIVVFTAAHPGQGGVGHVNEQGRPYWDQRFAEHGHYRQPQLEERIRAGAGDLPGWWLLHNLMTYSRV